MKITLELLKEHKACAAQAELFARLWPKGGKVSLHNLKRARKAGMDATWLCCLLSPQARAAFALAVKPAREAYDLAVKQASEAFALAVDAALVASFAD
ncbi:MAG: hypothetical protein MUP20_04220 [Methyloceanibacter sp.]|nr:hypothetical protein [Methyloceanibacter sp.]